MVHLGRGTHHPQPDRLGREAPAWDRDRPGGGPALRESPAWAGGSGRSCCCCPSAPPKSAWVVVVALVLVLGEGRGGRARDKDDDCVVPRRANARPLTFIVMIVICARCRPGEYRRVRDEISSVRGSSAYGKQAPEERERERERERSRQRQWSGAVDITETLAQRK